MKIVCGTDLSEASQPAVDAAAAMAQRAGAGELWLVHALTAEQDANATRRAEAAARLEEEEQRVRARLGDRVQSYLLQRPASAALLKFAEEKKADLIVVASHGETQSSLILLGGTAERVAFGARLPVVVVRDARPFEAWARGERPLRILMGVDWSASCEPALRWVRTLRTLGPCDLVAAHVYYPEEPERRYGLRATSAFDPDPQAVKLLDRDLAARLGDLGGEGKVERVVKLAIGRAGDHLIELAAAHAADLIVVGTHRVAGLSRLVSISSVVLRFSPLSVACVSAVDAHAATVGGRPRLQTVLVATDLSPFSNVAVPYGYELLCERGGELQLLHVRTDDAADAGEIEDQLRKLVPEFALRAGIKTTLEVVHAKDPARAICEAAERAGADVICVASHGRTGVLRAVLGSVAEAVLRQTGRSLFIVRPPR